MAWKVAIIVCSIIGANLAVDTGVGNDNEAIDLIFDVAVDGGSCVVDKAHDSQQVSRRHQVEFKRKHPDGFPRKFFQLEGRWDGYWSTPGPINYTDVISRLVDVELAPGAVQVEIQCNWMMAFHSYYRISRTYPDRPYVELRVNGRVEETIVAPEGGGDSGAFGEIVQIVLHSGDKVTTHLVKGRIFGERDGLMKTVFQGNCTSRY